MSRRTIKKTKMDWQSVTQGKPSQGDRVLLKVAMDGDAMHVVGWWSGEWMICDQLLAAVGDKDEVVENFRQDDVLAYSYFT